MLATHNITSNMPATKREMRIKPEAMEWEDEIDVSTDIYYSGEYSKDIFENERLREKKWVFTDRLSSRQESMREKCVDWLFEVCSKWRMSTDTFFISAALLDKALRAKHFPVDTMQILSGICLLVASKVEEVHPLPLCDIISVCPGTNIEQMKVMEMDVCKLMDWDTHVPLVMLYIRKNNQIVGMCDKGHLFSKYIATLFARSPRYMMHRQSQVAAAITYLARRLSGCPEEDAWSPREIKHTTYTLEDLRALISEVASVICAMNTLVKKSSRVPFMFKYYKSISEDRALKSNWLIKYDLAHPLGGA